MKGKDKGDPRATISASCVATTFVLLDKPAAKKNSKGGESDKPAAPKKVA